MKTKKVKPAFRYVRFPIILEFNNTSTKAIKRLMLFKASSNLFLEDFGLPKNVKGKSMIEFYKMDVYAQHYYSKGDYRKLLTSLNAREPLKIHAIKFRCQNKKQTFDKITITNRYARPNGIVSKKLMPEIDPYDQYINSWWLRKKLTIDSFTSLTLYDIQPKSIITIALFPE